MIPKEYINNIIDIYQEARIFKYSEDKTISTQIIRGRSYTVSSLVEDLTAVFLSKRTNSDLILVDYPITIKTQPSKTIYPDVCLIKNGTITDVFDLKMDTSFMKKEEEQKQLVDKWNLRIQSLIKNQNNREYVVHKDLKCHIIIISKKNGTIHNLNMPKNIFVYYLTSKIHPNEKNQNSTFIKRNIYIENSQFKALFQNMNCEKV